MIYSYNIIDNCGCNICEECELYWFITLIKSYKLLSCPNSQNCLNIDINSYNNKDKIFVSNEKNIVDFYYINSLKYSEENKHLIYIY